MSDRLERPGGRTKREGREVAGMRRGVPHCQCDGRDCVRILTDYLEKKMQTVAYWRVLYHNDKCLLCCSLRINMYFFDYT